MAIVWWSENFDTLKPNKDLDGQGGWTKVVDTSGGTIKALIDPTPQINGRGLLGVAQGGTGTVRYELNVAPQSQFEFTFKLKILNDSASGETMRIGFFDVGVGSLVDIDIVPGKVGPVTPTVGISNPSGFLSAQIALFQIHTIKISFEGGKIRLFVNGVLEGSIAEFGSPHSVDRIDLEIVRSVLDPAGLNRVFVDEFLGEINPVPPLILDFEPPEYTLTGGTGGTANLEGQDSWTKDTNFIGVSDFLITNNVAKVIAETQSLEINWPPTFITRYNRLVPPLNDSTTQFSFKFDPSPEDRQIFRMVGFPTTSGLENFSWLFVCRGDGWMGLVTRRADGNIRSLNLGQHDVLSAHTIIVQITAGSPNSTISITRDGVFLGSLEMQPDPILRISLDAFGVFGGSPVPMYLDNMVVQQIPLSEKLTPPQNVVAIRRENYTVVSWDAVTERTDGTPLTVDVMQYDVFRSNQFNETDKTLIKSITSVDANGKVDTVFIDTGKEKDYVYQIKAIALEDGAVLESELSERTEAVKLSAQIDDKGELIDRKLLALNQGRLGEGILA